MNTTFKATHVLAKNIEAGETVSIYGEDWSCGGFFKIYDGDSELERILLFSLRDPSVITFVHPTHQFIYNMDIYSDSQELPF